MKNKHLTFDERLEIETGLRENLSFKQIGKKISKNCTTVSREIRNHYKIERVGTVGRSFNNCLDRRTCPMRGKNCDITNCEEFKEEKCKKLEKAPYVCNGCKERFKCTLEKQMYSSSYAYKEYNDNLSESRTGITYSEKEIENLEEILYPLIVEQKQSIHMAYINNMDKIMCSEKEIYLLIDYGLFKKIRNIDLPKKVRFRQRPKNKTYYKIDKICLEGRKYSDYQKYIEENKEISIVQMDTVEGVKGGKVLLTIHFVSCSFMLAFIRDRNDSQSVIEIFNIIQEKIGLDNFRKLFQVILTDNGSEFSNPTKIEHDENGNQRTKVFYCDPSAPHQKGSCEVNHEFIRRIIPKGESFDEYTQKDINVMMSHINSYQREKLNNKSPIEALDFFYGESILSKFEITNIAPNEVTLNKNIFK